MPTALSDQRLIRISKAQKNQINEWREGADLVAKSGISIERLALNAAAHRLHLAYEHRRHGQVALAQNPAQYRTAISRYYYAMYHAMRAAAFIYHGGDDHEAHSELPKHTPKDFPQASVWQNELKSAREHRNRADYEPYPRKQSDWSPTAILLKRNANALLILTKNYLKSKGCKIK